MPSLRLLSHPERIQFMQLAQRLVMANGHISLFEAAALIVIQCAMAPQLEKPQPVSVSELRFSISILISAIAHLGENPAERFALAISVCRNSDLGFEPSFIEAIGVNGQRLVSSLQRLRSSSYDNRRKIISIMDSVVHTSPGSNIEENELLRATALALELPLLS
jgi:hypothetical protein